MREALKEAQLAFEEDEVPIGAIVVLKQQIIGKGHNLTERLTDVTAHAEIQAITAASSYLGGKYLKGCTIYVTLEPCVMCAGALFWSQIDRVVFGAYDLRNGASLTKHNLFHPKTIVEGGINEKESQNLIRLFFSTKRK